MLKFPFFFVFVHLVIHFLGTISLFEHSCAKCYADVDDYDAQRKWAILRLVSVHLKVGEILFLTAHKGFALDFLTQIPYGW